MRARMAAYMLHARYDPRETTKAPRVAFNQRFVDQVDPDRRLPEHERHRRADAARRAYFTRLAYLSARKRRSGRFGPADDRPGGWCLQMWRDPLSGRLAR